MSAPFTLVGLIGASLAIATTLWGVWHTGPLGAAFVATLAGSVAVALAAMVAAHGCFVQIGGQEIRDVVAWRTRSSVPRAGVVEARVLAGAWRRFELECDDGTFLTLVGASPLQFPSTLLPGAREKDLADLARLRGEKPRSADRDVRPRSG